MIVAAYDPGRITGYAQVALDRQGSIASLSVTAVDQFYDVAWVRKQLATDIAIADIIIVEDFIGAGPRTSDAIFTLKLVGYLQHTVTDARLVMQNPQVRKAFVTQARELLEARHKDRHGADALAHILAFLNRWL